MVEHPALDKACKGFVDALAEAGYVDGKNISIDMHNAQGDQGNCVTIANKLVNDKDDLIFAIATPAAQAVANLTKNIPILISAVTDPESAKLVKSNEKPETNVTGTSDLTPVAQQIKLLKKIVPSAKKVGLMYCSSEQNSIFQLAKLKDLNVLKVLFLTRTKFSRLHRALLEKLMQSTFRQTICLPQVWQTL